MRNNHPLLYSILFSKTFFVVCAAVLIFIIYNFTKISVTDYKTNQDIDALKKEAASLEGNQKRLTELRAFLSTDFFAEREARLKLGMQRKGESVAVLQTDADKIELKQERDATNPEPLSRDSQAVPDENDKKNNPMMWWDYFFHDSR